MSEQKTLVKQIIKDVKKGKSGANEWGNWTLYKIQFAQDKNKYSFFARETDIIPTIGANVLVVKYTEEQSGEYTNYTIKKMEYEESNSIINEKYVPQKTNSELYESRDVGILTSYAKDLFIAKMQFDKTIQEMTVPEICKQSVLCAKAMFNLVNGKSKPQVKVKPEIPPEEQYPEPIEPDMPF